MSYYAVVSLFIFKEDWNAYHPNSPVFETVLSPFVFEKRNNLYAKESLFKVIKTIKEGLGETFPCIAQTTQQCVGVLPRFHHKHRWESTGLRLV